MGHVKKTCNKSDGVVNCPTQQTLFHEKFAKKTAGKLVALIMTKLVT